MNKDYVFHIKWESRHRDQYRVGFLAQLDDYFYLVIKSEENAKNAYNSGFAPIAGFKPEEIYRSQELFDFFKSRILKKMSSNPCEELERTGAKSMVDSYFLEKVSDKVSNKYKSIILEAYELQEKRKTIPGESDIGASKNTMSEKDTGDIDI